MLPGQLSSAFTIFFSMCLCLWILYCVGLLSIFRVMWISVRLSVRTVMFSSGSLDRSQYSCSLRFRDHVQLAGMACGDDADQAVAWGIMDGGAYSCFLLAAHLCT